MKYSKRKRIVASTGLTNLYYIKKLLGFLFYTFFICIFALIINYLIYQFCTPKTLSYAQWIATPLGELIIYIALGLSAICIGKAKLNLGTIKREKIALLTLLCILVALTGFLPEVSLITALSQIIGEVPETDLIKNINVGTFFSVCILAPIVEELIFRGVVERILLKLKTSPWVGIIASAMLFAMIHEFPYQVISAFIGGVIYGWVYYKTKSIYLTFSMHAVNNIIASIVFFLDDGVGGSDAFPPILYVFAGLSLLLFIFFIVRLSYKLKDF
ncbi:CPBP family intramembrane glutamic endopeptidase [Prevotella histicola]|uniref:CPBP family intramembrane glutamic endopeptidase n=1 Tax=Prevotella histicola TaxID=470565 RepID=UPI001C5E0918|nr:type II CAAX endopeptidase family protein [Prevotella histicola]MBW4777597.1 CPBP family intramembrane metalloprotease [Prevotella histicola]